jgi:hypothetical protein
VQFYTGGTVYRTSNWVVHTFSSTGTLAPTTPTQLPALPTIGAAYGGGFFAGQVTTNGIVYNLIVCDATVGQTSAKTWGTAGITVGISSVIDGPTNTTSIATLYPATSYAASWCKSLSSGGFTDWYLPALNELETCYYFLKPGTQSNHTGSGSNANAVSPEPISTNYTAGAPAQTSATNFRTGASAQEFTTGQYWASTESPANGAWTQSFGGSPGAGYQDWTLKSDAAIYTRAIRRVPA